MAPSNVAADHIASKLVSLNMAVVRLFARSRISTSDPDFAMHVQIKRILKERKEKELLKLFERHTKG